MVLATSAAMSLTYTSAIAEGTPVRGGILKLGFSADPAGFDPARGPSGMSHVVIEQVYSTLMSLDADAKPYPDLATEYEISDDGLEYTFKLREGVMFHDGEELTAEDVKYTFDRLRDEDSGYSYGSQVENIDEVVVVDDYTVKFELSEITGPFLTYMAFPGSSIVPMHLLESDHDLNAKPVGSGPFKFVSYEPRSMVRFERNDNFYEEGKPYLDGLEYHLIADVTALTNAVVSGTINFSNEIPPKDWAMVTSTPGIEGAPLAGSRYYWLLPNNENKPLDNPKVRQAIAHAIDRNAIVRGAFFGQAEAFRGGVIPSWNWGHADLDYFEEGANPDKARELLAEAGHPDGFETSMTMASSFPAMVSMAPILQANLAAVGIKAEIKTMEVPRFWDEVWGPSNFDMTAMYWLSPLADPDDFVGNNYACGRAINVQKSCTEEMDDILARAVSAPTREERLALYREQQELSLEQMPIVPLVNSLILTAHTDKLRNFKPMRTGFLKTIKDAWLDGQG
ncbi:ABC transporter substrate-binding protein [Rhodobacteraceae bacterium F11138]|nr:ABC transporter substrate-binding protein [Rhodobacteraceae bacterium F11138]